MTKSNRTVITRSDSDVVISFSRNRLLHSSAFVRNDGKRETDCRSRTSFAMTESNGTVITRSDSDVVILLSRNRLLHSTAFVRNDGSEEQIAAVVPPSQ